jgi:hypothetical protein
MPATVGTPKTEPTSAGTPTVAEMPETVRKAKNHEFLRKLAKKLNSAERRKIRKKRQQERDI